LSYLIVFQLQPNFVNVYVYGQYSEVVMRKYYAVINESQMIVTM